MDDQQEIAFLDTAGHLHIRIRGSWDSVHITCIRSHQTKGRRVGMKPHPQLKSYGQLLAAGRGCVCLRGGLGSWPPFSEGHTYKSIPAVQTVLDSGGKDTVESVESGGWIWEEWGSEYDRNTLHKTLRKHKRLRGEKLPSDLHVHTGVHTHTFTQRKREEKEREKRIMWKTEVLRYKLTLKTLC